MKTNACSYLAILSFGALVFVACLNGQASELTQGGAQKKIIEITHNGFPLESFPPQGEVTLKYEDGTQKTILGTPIDYCELMAANGFTPAPEDACDRWMHQ